MQLSSQSIAFLKSTDSDSGAPQEPSTWRLNYARLFCELYEVIRSANASLDDLSLGKWSMNYNSEGRNQALSFTFRLDSDIISDRSKVTIQIEPHGTSSIEVSSMDCAETSPLVNEELKSFYLSPSYKRYFAPHTRHLDKGIRTIIPRKQITSRHFGAYVIHLLQMARPYLIATCRSHAHAA